MNSLPIQIFNDVRQAQANLVERAWGAALTLVAMILHPHARRPRDPAKEPIRMSHASRATSTRASGRCRRCAMPVTRRQAARARGRPRRTSRRPGRTVTLEGLHAYYGDTHAVKGVDLKYAAERGDGDDRAVGLREVDPRALHQPHARGDPGRAQPRAGSRSTTGHLREGRRRRLGAPRDRDGLPEAESVPDDVDLRQRRRRAAARPASAATSRSASRSRCAGAGLWEEVKDRLGQPGHRPLRRPAAAPVHRAHDRRRAGGDHHGRAVLGARSDLDAEDRGARRRSSRSASPSSS